MTSHPLFSLIVATGLVVLAAALLWPGRGLLWRWIATLRRDERVLIEDALKHLYDCQYHQHPCTWHSLSGALELPGHRATALLGRLIELSLVASQDGAYQLTSSGRRDALRVIRIHRLWERYLSEETGLDPSDWHRVADRREHSTTPEQVREMAARMGHPRYDPHGDPIPSSEGEMPPALGEPLDRFPVGKVAEVVHLEDEPQAVYAQLVAEGLYVGMRVRVFETTPERICFEADGEEHVLAPVVAANLSVIAVADDAVVVPTERMSALRLGEQARVAAIAPVCRGMQRRRLLDLGIVPGTRVEAEMRSPGGDPTAYRIRGALVALRRDQAEMIHVTRSSEESGTDRVATGGGAS